MKFKDYLVNSGFSVGSCVTLVLCWIMTCDEEVSEREITFIRSFCSPIDWEFVSSFLEAGPRDISDDVVLALRLLDKNLDLDGRSKLIQLLFGLVIADNRLSHSELHVIRFVADLFGVMPKSLNNIYCSITGKDLPEPADPSSKKWWISLEEKRKKERTQQNRDEEEREEKRYFSEEKISWAFSVLGLELGAPLEAIKQSFRRLCNQHHPDRFTKLGPEAVAAANVIFARINEAYEILGAL